MIASNVSAGYDDEGNRDSTPRGPYQCACGKWYSTHQALVLCIDNEHGAGKDRFSVSGKYRHDMVTEITAVCAECGERLRSRIQWEKGSIELRVWPHVCAVDSGE